jgi:hypothetical protein
MVDGEHARETPVMVGGTVATVIAAEPDTLVYPACVELALHEPVPATDGVKTPVEVMEPPVADHVTPELNDPVPLTVAAHVAVCAVVMEAGVAATVMPVIVAEGDVMVIDAVEDFEESCVDVALMVSRPEEGTVEDAV